MFTSVYPVMIGAVENGIEEEIESDIGFRLADGIHGADDETPLKRK